MAASESAEAAAAPQALLGFLTGEGGALAQGTAGGTVHRSDRLHVIGVGRPFTTIVEEAAAAAVAGGGATTAGEVATSATRRHGIVTVTVSPCTTTAPMHVVD